MIDQVTLDLAPEEQVFKGVGSLELVKSKLDIEAFIDVECDGTSITEVLNGVS